MPHVSHTLVDTPCRTPAEVLRGAAAYLTRHGWIQGGYYGTDGATPPADLDGAVAMAAFGRVVTGPFAGPWPGVSDYWCAWDVLVDFLDRHTDLTAGVRVPQQFNDHAERTAADVIGVLVAAADEWDRAHPDRRQYPLRLARELLRQSAQPARLSVRPNGPTVTASAAANRPHFTIPALRRVRSAMRPNPICGRTS